MSVVPRGVVSERAEMGGVGPKIRFGAWCVVACLTAGLAHGADVTWVGPMSGNWSVAENWSGGVVPEPEDNVTIPGGTVTVTDARVVEGSFTLEGNAVLQVRGVTASFTVTGPAQLDNGILNVTEGAVVDLSTVASYHRTLCEPNPLIPVVGFVTVSGNGSRLNLSGIETMSVDAPSCNEFTVSVSAFGGGMVDLSGLKTVTSPGDQTFTFNIVGEIDLSSLESMDSTTFNVLGTASVALPSLTSLMDSAIMASPGINFTANALPEAHNVSIFSGLPDSVVMDGLTALTDSFLSVGNGGRVMFPSLTTLFNTTVTIGSNALFDVPELTSFSGNTNSTFLTGVDGGMIAAPRLMNIDNLHISASMGSVISLPAVTSYSWTVCEGMGLGSFTAGGDGSVIDLSGVRTLTINVPGCGNVAFVASANTGGELDLSGLTTVTIPGMQIMTFLAGGPGSRIDVSSLRTFNPARVNFFEVNLGEILRAAGGGGTGGGGGCGAGGPGMPWRTGDVVVVAMAALVLVRCRWTCRGRPELEHD